MRLLYLLPIAFLLISCRVDPRQRVVGNWTVDLNKTQMPATISSAMKEQARSLVGSAGVKFNSTGDAILSGPVNVEGKWTYEDGKVLLKPKDPAMLRRFGMDDTLTFTIDPDFQTLSWPFETPLGKATLVMVKTG